MLISPPLPTAPVSTKLYAPLENPLLPTPSKLTVSRAEIFTLPASPFPPVEANSKAPPVTSSEPVVMLMSPPLPTGYRWRMEGKTPHLVKFREQKELHLGDSPESVMQPRRWYEFEL